MIPNCLATFGCLKLMCPCIINDIDPILSKLVGNKDIRYILDEFCKIGTPTTKLAGLELLTVSCLFLI